MVVADRDRSHHHSVCAVSTIGRHGIAKHGDGGLADLRDECCQSGREHLIGVEQQNPCDVRGIVPV